jgi:Uma2 family endonuclease
MLVEGKETKETFKFSYQHLLELDQLGIFGDQRVELIDGEIIPMPPPNPPHAIFVMELGESLARTLHSAAKVSIQNPLRLSLTMDSKHLPIPDLMVLERRVYLDHPQPEDVYLLVEVADSSLLDDREKKLNLYAQHHIKEYWIVNLANKQIEVYTEPKGDEYLSRQTHKLTDHFALSHFPDLVQQWLLEEVMKVLE